MRRLRLTIPLQSGETAMSFASRLAARNGTKARALCRDFDLSFQGVVDGNAETLQGLGDLAGVDGNALQSGALVKSGPLQWTYRGETLHRTVLRRERIALCPACALADIEASPHLRPTVAVYGRMGWLLDPVRTCPVHRMPLTVAAKPSMSSFLHDFSHHAAAVAPDLAQIAAAAPRRDPGALETYVLTRLEGTGAAPLLDPMSLAGAVRLCETAGAVALFGPKVDLKKLSGDDRHAAGGHGFAAIAGGVEAFTAFLDALRNAVGPRARVDGPGVAFGRLFDLLRITRSEREFDAVRDAARAFILDNFALDHTHNILGQAIERRRVHTLHTLAKETSVHPKTLRKHLRAAGLITEAQMAMSDNNIRIEADRAIEIARQLEGTLSLAEAMVHINAPRAQMDVLVKAGLIQPQQRMTGFGAQNRYAIADLDAFIARLARKARKPERPNKVCAIPTAAKRCCCSATEIVRLILDGKLRTYAGSIRGFMGVMVDPLVVGKALHRPEASGMTLRKAARELATSDDALEALIAGKHLACFVGTNPVNRCPQRLVAANEVKRFKAKYVSLWALSKERGVYMATLKTRLDRAGVKPEFDPVMIGARFYRRDNVIAVTFDQ
ncbi:lambda repressor-like predicted transcriptional regulator [Bradyrhizobium ottawaense]|uniref:TniQ family protein n=1 Tax=Bradyrhizobium ottawaense TaxID=931866 RepID=UPI00351826FC